MTRSEEQKIREWGAGCMDWIGLAQGLYKCQNSCKESVENLHPSHVAEFLIVVQVGQHSFLIVPPHAHKLIGQLQDAIAGPSCRYLQYFLCEEGNCLRQLLICCVLPPHKQTHLQQESTKTEVFLGQWAVVLIDLLSFLDDAEVGHPGGEGQFELHLGQDLLLHQQQLLLAVRVGSVLQEPLQVLRVDLLILGRDEERSSCHQLDVVNWQIFEPVDDGVEELNAHEDRLPAQTGPMRDLQHPLNHYLPHFVSDLR